MGAENSKGPPPSKVFGRSLQDLYTHYREIFPPLRVSLEFLAQDAVLAQRNIFFRPRSELELRELEQYFEAQTDRPDVLTLNSFSPHTVAGFVKEFFERLPEPLLTYDRFEQFTHAMDKLEDVYHACSLQPDFYDKLFFIQALVHTLPKAHYITLERTVRLFAALSSDQAPNSVTAQRLGVIFGCCFLRRRPPPSEPSGKGDDKKQKPATQKSDNAGGGKRKAEAKAPVVDADEKGAVPGGPPPEAAAAAVVQGGAAQAPAAVGASVFGLKGGRGADDWHVDRMAEDERAHHCVAFLIENHAEIFGLNPVRELKLMAKHYKSMKTVYSAREDQLKKSEERQLRVKVKAAEDTFARRIVMRHFTAWQRVVSTKKQEVATDTVHLLRNELVRVNSNSRVLHAVDRGLYAAPYSSGSGRVGKENSSRRFMEDDASSADLDEAVKRQLSTHGSLGMHP